MKILILGAHGLLGQALADVFRLEDLTAVDRDTLDITDENALQKFCRKVGPEIIINAAAYNAVDAAEGNETAARQAFAVNAEGVLHLAEAAIDRGALLVHFSTDYVFDGQKKSPYVEDDKPRPLSAYGRSKLDGENKILCLRERGLRYYLIRTSRLFGSSPAGGMGKKTFVDVVLGAAAQKDIIEFIDDEISSPTYVDDLARAVKELLLARPAIGIYHRTNDGACSWCEFAKAILDESDLYTADSSQSGRKYVKLRPISAVDLPRPARRPAYSVLKSTKLSPLRHWREALSDYLTSNLL